ncbi:MAG: MBOAT family protein [Nostoc sp. GBBB01]|uniref:MBOAT family protein n=1 Tax=Nostoc punctiforme FACHB-252 TaxID=1357509 RepID=A0ABR8HDQ1_NOSPU|nr:MBOAT family protein [Nostoc punctiforme FACHB-252]MBL1198695.1 MBOAT family protein [Nostoc sp. GBBB01]
MLFNSFEFIFVFLPITIFGFYGLGSFGLRQAAIIWLVLASFVFYGYWNYGSIILIISSMIFNYRMGIFLGNKYQNNPVKSYSLWVYHLFLYLGIAVNLAILGYYKYANFLIDNFNVFTGAELNLKNIILPLGISFFTFQKIAYLVDSYNGKTRNYSFLDYCLFVIFFPQLIAGPIVHHWEIVPQFANQKIIKFSYENFALGWTIFSLGLFKKVIIADGVSAYSTPIFVAAASGTELDSFEAWRGVLAYTFQLYFDFSGYSDMAIGISRIFGITLPINFDSPYKANSIIDFWRRWHITLSRFLKDYLYIPLGGNRKGETRRYLNLLITMLLGGLWHGASWTFVIWGGLHGCYLIINHLHISLKKYLSWHNNKQSILEILFYRILTFLSVVIAWVFFRSESLDGAIIILQSMMKFNFSSFFHNNLSNLTSNIVFYGFWLPFLLLIVWFAPNTQQILMQYKPTLSSDDSKISHAFLWKPNLLWATSLGLISFIAISKVLEAKASEFLYFQF